jgi:hypothetical protein
MAAPLLGVELAHERERVEVVAPDTANEPGAVGAVATLTVVVAVLVPFAFVAVRVKTVVAPSAGVVVLVPVTAPTPWSMESEVALLTVQLKVEVPFRATVAGEALKPVMEGVMPESVAPDATDEDAERFPTLSRAVT